MSNYRNERGQMRNKNYGDRGYQQNSGYRGNDEVKKSGATYTRIRKGKHEGLHAVNAWRRTRNGLVVASAFPVDGVEHESEKGNISLRYVVDVVNRDMGTTQTYWCLMQKSSQKIYIRELGLVISPNGSGITAGGKRVTGFFGRVRK